ncbi:MAG: N-acetyltransferase [Oceanicaulis sp.]|uniref:GNAT family N-acetyltransferase n=1 Tax=Glycocaulis sp. TaxID=1969725 RepID=UPI0025BA017B|nr:GNAT family N-acetyltransferase [Glycocaulis sp.]MCC5981752.1 N-acetyltransferase [Oceanicaulis sp.]MCH8520474.1 N-acetyltransferase family protein [Glycocaulis sp.]
MAPSPLIRPVQIDDAPAIHAIYAPIVANTAISLELEIPPVEEIARRINAVSSEFPYLAALLDGHLAGYAYGSRFRSRAAYDASVEVTVYVGQEFRGRGVAKALYAALFDALRVQQRHMAFAVITLPNTESVSLHEAAGFEPAGVWKEAGFKFGRWYDVGCWQKCLAGD